ncbi:C4-dicarboxylate TRAP transporter substrate-binding protein [Pseudohoeflea coraliihabitans]|uniref:C4-dicarboxylate TRAP transporter substrate-binding protein n=1 Tax=Pseudohoeflea coraliihabitans TaxID=2860393 RepID=A0ABS6WSV7_9HYPH|nr:C4-dicarboxylate TRAP transporter substrate-binding protein [Pseudohoeflea sp. DP4N28-3]MBW3099038.1 C4-dicarboxylate TRAP transporter substrate-binding protein [Pseudohoeflea sp. DP4N28-3]
MTQSPDRNTFRQARRLLVAGLFASGCGLALPAHAAEEIDVSIVSGFSPAVAAVKMLKESFMPGVDERLAKTGNYKINWQEAFSGTLAKPAGELEAIETGLADMGVIPTGFHADKLPVYQIGYVTPFTTTDLVLIHKVVDELVEKYPAFRETWEGLNQVTLSASGIPDNYIICSSKPVESVADIEGLKIAGAGPNLRWIEPAGATGVTGSLGNFYQLVETGVVDAMLVWGESVVSLKFYEVCGNYFDAKLGGVNSYVINANKQSWESYPDEVKEAMIAAAKDYGVDIGEFAARLGAKARETVLENGGTVVEIDPAERTELAESLPNLAQEWAESLEAQGVPAKEILAEYMQAMRDADQPIARQWDQ